MRDSRAKSGFYTRGFTTFVLAAAFLVLAVSGAVLYITPRGRVANWTDWSLLGLGKEQWGSVHITIATLFLLAAALHLFFNWKVILGYIRLKKIAGFRLKQEFAAALAVGVFFIAGTLAGIPPFSTIVVLHDEIKDYWERTSVQAPQPHAEELPMEELARQLNRPVDEVLAILDKHGYSHVEPSLPVARIAEANAVAPSEIYEVVRAGLSLPETHSEGTMHGSGLGMMTLDAYCSAESLPVEMVMAWLSSKGVAASCSSTLRELALSLNMRPGQLVESVREVVNGS